MYVCKRRRGARCRFSQSSPTSPRSTVVHHSDGDRSRDVLRNIYSTHYPDHSSLRQNTIKSNLNSLFARFYVCNVRLAKCGHAATLVFGAGDPSLLQVSIRLFTFRPGSPTTMMDGPMTRRGKLSVFWLPTPYATKSLYLILARVTTLA